MTPERILELLQAVASGSSTPAAAMQQLAWNPIEQVNGNGDTVVARIDHHRALRLGYPEVVLCQGKTVDQIVAICSRLASTSGGFLATRADEAARNALRTAFPNADINDLARTAFLSTTEVTTRHHGNVLIATAGTGDIPVAEEAAVTARAFGNPVDVLYDVGVAGIHRLLRETDLMSQASVIIVVAGMEGALASVVGGLVAVPVIAVPTSVGYGASFGGIAALLAMLNSCASGVTVMNIDNGFGAACAATRINQLLTKQTSD